ncbi:MAG: TIGR03013 family PEP-CTERM/XrtA system glycosyltransferase [Alphaproteobacteria bacterium]|nr:MAG: TIGR03013 family PEP-CTERM/XrtA system glycosyltransferase [Alphaproteobacteria bacterium]
MIKLLSMHVPKPFLALAAVEAAILMLSLYTGVLISWVNFDFSYRDFIEFLPEALSFASIMITVMFALGLYNETIALTLPQVIVRMTVSFVLGFVILSAIFYMVPAVIIWRSVMAGTMVTAYLGVLLARTVFLHAIDLTPLKRRIVVVGSGARAARIEQLERRGQAFGFVCLGYLPTPGETPAVSAERILDPATGLCDFARRNNISEIVIAPEDRRQRLPMEELAECAFQGISVCDFLRFWEREAKRVDLDALPQNWLIYSSSFPGNRLHRFFKRLFDIVVSVIALILLMPLLVSTAIAIRLDSPGPVFYRQQRVGLRGQPFELLKFRSMRPDAERDGPRWAAARDDRVTTIGSFIRKVRIDELPQIFNVLKGEMSFVGPRPERPFFVEQLAKEIPFYRERFRVKPGITGWAQLNYPYGASVADARAKLEYDLYYIRHFGLMLDTIIVLQTIRVVLWPPPQNA